ncbi:oxygenase MpaB family protein [Nocardia nova]|uniref:oxygenase MpaB family protein n=1 Tax=Nocardia nova TaxID=37330 RepID=UPI0033C9A1A6
MPDIAEGVAGAGVPDVRLGPGSMLWRHLGDRRFLATLPRAVGLQMLHPSIAAAQVEHVRVRLWDHKRRTVQRLIALAYIGRDPSWRIRVGHEHVKGIDEDGHRYHALNPDLFFFQHATYVETLFTMINTFIAPMTAAEHEQLYAETCLWYRRYGISDRMVPATWTEFTEYFDEACRTQLRPGTAFETVRGQVLRPDAWSQRFVPTRVVRALHHDHALELMGVRRRTGDHAALATYRAAVRASLVVRHRFPADLRSRLDVGSPVD